MFKKLSILAALSAIAALTSANVLAQNSLNQNLSATSATKTSGVYVEGNVGYGEMNESFPAGYTNTSTSDITFNLNAGYKFNPNFALEAGYFYLPKEKADFSGYAINNYGQAIPFTGDISVKNYMFDVVAKGILPLDNGFSLFGKLGLGYVYRDADATVTNGATGQIGYGTGNTSRMVGVLGAGVGYAINQNLEVTLQGVATTKSGDEVPASFLSLVGLTYTF